MCKDPVLEQTSMFNDLSDEQCRVLHGLFVEQAILAGHAIFEQGQPAEHLYLLVSGDVLVRYKPYDGPELTIARVRPGEVFGWSAALSSPTYTSSAYALTDSRLLRVHGEDLARVYEHHPEVGLLVLERLAMAISLRVNQAYEQMVKLLMQTIQNGIQSRRMKNGCVRTGLC